MKRDKDKKAENKTIGVDNYVQHSMAILDRIHELIDVKFEGKQIELANKLGKKESEISKWLHGVQNFTLFTIAKLEEAFGESIIKVQFKNNAPGYYQLGTESLSTKIESATFKIDVNLNVVFQLPASDYINSDADSLKFVPSAEYIRIPEQIKLQIK